MVKKKRTRNLRQLLQMSVIGVLAILIGIVSFSNLYEKRLISQAYVENPTETGALTNTLLSQLEEYERINQPFGDQTKKRLVQSNINKLAQQRYNSIKRLTSEKNQNVLSELTLSPLRESFPSSTKRFIEKKIKKTDKIRTIHVHGHTENSDEELNSYLFRLGKQNTKLLFIDKNPFINSDSTVLVQGYSYTIDNSIITTTEQFEDIGITVQRQSDVKTTGTRNHVAAVISFSTSDEITTSNTNVQQSLLKSLEGELNDYYQENSFNQLDFSITNVLLASMPEDYNTDSTDPTKCAENIVRIHDALKNKFPANPDGYIYFLPGNCSFVTDQATTAYAAGWGSIGGTPSVAWIHLGRNPTSQIISNNISSAYHEIGHNLGLWHASYMQCSGSKTDINTYLTTNPFCQNIIDYGDSQDVMGKSTTKAHFNAPYKNQLGWIRSTNVVEARNYTVEQPQRFVIAPIETLNTDNTSKQIVVVNLPSTPDYYYYISYRRPIGFDSNLSTTVTNGASIHLINETESDRSLLIHPRLDTNLSNNSETAALADGDSYLDTLNNIQIRQVSHTNESVTIEVSAVVQPTLTPTKPPTLTPTPILIVNPELGGVACGSGEWVCNSHPKCANIATQALFNAYWCDGEAQWKWEAANNSNSCGGAISRPRTQGC